MIETIKQKLINARNGIVIIAILEALIYIFTTGACLVMAMQIFKIANLYDKWAYGLSFIFCLCAINSIILYFDRMRHYYIECHKIK
jgi:hypothetical protein